MDPAVLVTVGASVTAVVTVEWVGAARKKREARRQEQQWHETEAKIRAALAARGRQDVIDDVRLRAVANQAHLDHICQATATALSAPAAVITVVEIEGQRWLAHYGAEWCNDDTRVGLIQPLETSYCQYVVANDAPLVIEDSFTDIRVRRNAQETREQVRAYIGSPVHASDGTPVGSLCVFDTMPRRWTKRDRVTVDSFARLVNL